MVGHLLLPFLLGLLFCAKAEDEIRLSEASVLLPFSTKVSYEIHALKGCFRWSVDSSLLQLEQPDECGSKVVIRPNSDTPGERRTIQLLASDSQSRRVLRCAVFLDTVKKFDIKTTTKTLVKDQAQRVTIHGYDDHENLFSTLEGLEFTWDVDPPILKFVPFAHSTVTPSSTTNAPSNAILRLEEKEKKSSTILVVGVGVGKVNVSAHIVDKVSVDPVADASVELTIKEPLELDPPGDVYITVGAVVQYRLQARKSGGVEVIHMPHPKYQWLTYQPEIASVSSSGLLTAQKLGQTVVEAQFTELTDNKASGNVFVVEPAYLELSVTLVNDNSWSGLTSDVSPWYLLRDRDYHLRLRVAPIRRQKYILITPNIQPTFVLPNDHFSSMDTLHSATINATALSLLGPTTVEVSIPGLSPLVQRIVIVDPVEIDSTPLVSPKVLRLPPDHQYTLEANGGSGTYLWVTERDPIVTVEEKFQNSTLVSSGNHLGTSYIRCMDNKCTFNVAEIDVHVSLPKSVEFYASENEVLIGEHADLFVMTRDSHQNLFDNCSAVDFAATIANQDLFKLVSIASCGGKVSCPKGACKVITVLALNEGETYAIARHGGYEGKTPLVAYRSLRVSHDRVLVSLGASFTIGVQGGPKPWQSHRNDHSEVLTPQDARKVRIEATRGPTSFDFPWRLHTLTCLELGTQNISVVVVNRSAKITVSQSASFIFSCKEPSRIFMYPHVDEVPASMPDDCVDSMKRWALVNSNNRPSTFRVRTGIPRTFRLEAYDLEGFSFHNFSTIATKMVTNERYIQAIDLQTPHHNSELTFPNIYLSLHPFTFHPETGKTTIEVSLYEYHMDQLISAGVPHHARIQLQPVRASFSFLLYPAVSVYPPVQMVYWHPANVFKLDVIGGSTHYETDINTTSLVELIKQQPSYLDIKPLGEGHAFVTITDSCMPSDRAISDIFISGVHKIKIKVFDMIKIDEKTPLEVFAYDKRGEPFPDSQYKYLVFESHIDHNQVLKITSSEVGSRRMTVHALALGSCSITVTNKEGDGIGVTSLPTFVQVFPALELVPQKLVLLPGAIFQIQWRGGPPARTQLHFEMEDARTSVARIDANSGMLHANQIGETLVVATAYTHIQENEDAKKDLGRAYATVLVKHLRGIRIAASTSTLLVGEEVVLEVRGSEGETPFSWSKLDIEFAWDVGSRNVQLEPLNKGTHISLDEESSFGIRVFALSAGRAIISVRITKCPSWLKLEGMTASFTITTVERLRLLSPSSVLIAPESHYKIQTNYDVDPTRSLRYDILTHELDSKDIDRPVLVVASGGLITTTTSAGSMYIRISERDSVHSLSQSVLLKVTVKPITHLSLSPALPANYGISVGKSQKYDIVVRDEVGIEFDSYDGVSFDYLLNVLDVVSISLVHQGNSTTTDVQGYRDPSLPKPRQHHPYNGADGGTLFLGHSSIIVDGLSPGSAILRLFLRGEEYPKMVHFPFTVHNSIEPSDVSIHVDGEMQFTTSFLQDTQAYRNAWSSSDPSVVRIDPSGTAYAVSVGTATIYFNSTVHTHTEVRVLPIISIESGDQSLSFSNSDQLTIRVPFKFLGGGGENLIDSAGVKQKIDYNCRLKSKTDHRFVDLRGAAHATEENVEDVGFFCTVALRLSTLMKQFPDIKSIKDLHHVNLQVEASSHSLTSAADLSLFPLFEIENGVNNITFLSNELGAKGVGIVWYLTPSMSPPPLDITVGDSQLQVQIDHARSATGSTVFYWIRMGNPAGPNGEYTYFQNSKVVFKCPKTGQQAQIAVSYGYSHNPEPTHELPPYYRTEPRSVSFEIFFSLLMALVLLGVLFLWYKFGSSSSNSSNSQNFSTVGLGMNQPRSPIPVASPQRATPGGSGGKSFTFLRTSPRSPSNFAQ